MDIVLQGLTREQVELADQIWACDTDEDVNNFIQSLEGHKQQQARVVYEMMILAAIDAGNDHGDFSLANSVIEMVK